MPHKSTRITALKALILLALLAGISAAQVKNVAVVEMEIDAQSGAAAEITPAEVRLMTAGLRREAVKNLPKDRYNIMTSETVMSQGSAVLEACADENCVITLGARIGADYIVRGIISKLRARFALSVEIYETENGNLVASSELVSSENVGELVEKGAGAFAEMYKTFANATQSVMQKPTAEIAETVNQQPEQKPAAKSKPERKEKTQTNKSGGEKNNTHWSWGKFPPKEAGRGEVRLGMQNRKWFDDIFDLSYFDLYLDTRYSIIHGLEAWVNLPIPLIGQVNGIRQDGYAGLSGPTVGMRYWLPIGIGFFSDLTLPIDTRDSIKTLVYYSDGHYETAKHEVLTDGIFDIGAQYSTTITEKLSFGSQLCLIIPFEDKYGNKSGMDLSVGVELDYSIGMFTPFLAFNILLGLPNTYTYNSYTMVTRPIGIFLSIGTIFEINNRLNIGAYGRYEYRYMSGYDIGAFSSFNF